MALATAAVPRHVAHPLLMCARPVLYTSESYSRCSPLRCVAPGLLQMSAPSPPHLRLSSHGFDIIIHEIETDPLAISFTDGGSAQVVCWSPRRLVPSSCTTPILGLGHSCFLSSLRSLSVDHGTVAAWCLTSLLRFLVSMSLTTSNLRTRSPATSIVTLPPRLLRQAACFAFCDGMGHG